MNIYTFKLIPIPAFNIEEVYDEVNLKILNEELEKLRVKITAEDIKNAIEVAKNEAATMIAVNYSDMLNIDKYQIKISVVSIEVIDQLKTS